MTNEGGKLGNRTSNRNEESTDESARQRITRNIRTSEETRTQKSIRGTILIMFDDQIYLANDFSNLRIKNAVKIT